MRVIPLRVDLGALIVLLKPAHRHPVVAVITCRVSDETNVVRRDPAARGSLGEEGIHLLPAFRVHGMAGFRADQKKCAEGSRFPGIALVVEGNALPLELL